MKSIEEAGTENIAEAKLKIRIAKARARQEDIAARIKGSLNSVKDLEQARVRWERYRNELPTNTDGRFIASSAEAVSSYASERDVEHVSGDEIQAKKVSLEALLRPIEDALADKESLFDPDADTQRILGETQQWIFKSLSSYRKSNDLIEGLITQGKKNRVVGPLLQVAMDLQRAEYAKQRAEKAYPVVKAGEQETSELNAKLIAQKAKSEREMDEMSRSQQRRTRQALAPETLKAFSPFLGKGLVDAQGHPCDRSCLLSLNQLIAIGALETAENFVRVASDPADEWRTPRWGSAERAEAQKLLEQFKDLAPVWVQNGYLAP